MVTALTDLLKSRPLSEITVSDLCESCDIPRQTFYYHFDNMMDMFIWSVMVNLRDDGGRPSFVGGIGDVCEALYSRKELTTAFFSSKYREKILSTMKEGFEVKAAGYIRDYVVERMSEDVLRFSILVLVNGSLGIIADWIDDGMDISVPDVRKALDELIRIVIRSDILE